MRKPLAEQGAPAAELLCDRVEESCRAITPKRLTTELGAEGRGQGRSTEVL